jgi:hypothetical protein
MKKNSGHLYGNFEKRFYLLKSQVWINLAIVMFYVNILGSVRIARPLSVRGTPGVTGLK